MFLLSRLNQVSLSLANWQIAMLSFSRRLSRLPIAPLAVASIAP